MANAGLTSKMTTQGIDVENEFGATKQQNAVAINRHFKHVQHACANKALANSAADFAKNGAEYFVPRACLHFRNTLRDA